MLEYLIDDKLVDAGDRIAVGVSGGADSMLLLWALLDKQKQVGYKLFVVNVNHHIRGEESDRDSKFVEDFCKKKKLDYVIEDVDAMGYKEKQKCSIEESARILRYEVFGKVMKQQKLNKLFLAHHKNDQAETILMHIARGSGIFGASGIGQSEIVCRPLLGLTKKEILKIASEHGVSFVEDSTNKQSDTARNYFRNIIIPEIEKVYPNAVSAIFDFGERCREIGEFVKSFMNPNLVEQTKDYVLIKGSVADEKPFLFREYVKMAFEKLGVMFDVESKHYLLIYGLFNAEVSKKLDMPHNTMAQKTYDGVILYKKEKDKKIVQEVRFCVGKSEVSGMAKIEVSAVSPKDVVYGEGDLFVDASKIPLDAIWRTRQDGDMFAKLGTGTKKLNDYFTDKKIPLIERDKTLVLAHGNKILLVAGHDISESVKIDGETDTILKLHFDLVMARFIDKNN